MKPWQAADHPKAGPSNLDAPGNDSPAAARKLSKQLGDANRKQKRKLAQLPKAATAANITTAVAVHANGGGVSLHPILGFPVPHSRRSYHRDSPLASTKSRSSAPAAAAEMQGGRGGVAGAEGEGRNNSRDFKSSAAPAPAAGRHRKPGAAAPHARPSLARSEMPRAGSDSSMTVSADST